MILDLLIDADKKISTSFTRQFSKANLADLDSESSIEAQVSRIEEKLGEPSIQHMLIYSKKYLVLGNVLSRKYVNSAKIGKGPLKLADMILLPDHLSRLPSKKERNRVLFLAPHCDEAYLATILLHKLIGDDVFLFSFTFPKGEKSRIDRAYKILGLEKDDYSLGSLEVNNLFEVRDDIREILRELLDKFKPNVVLSVFPKGANFDHIAMAQVVRKVILKETKADLIYGYVIQSRNKNPIIFPLFSSLEHRTILQAFGKKGLGKIFRKYLPFLKFYMQTYSEPLLRMMGDGKLSTVYSLPLEGERICNYRIPNLLDLACE